VQCDGNPVKSGNATNGGRHNGQQDSSARLDEQQVKQGWMID
jgi:hypothetical protein